MGYLGEVDPEVELMKRYASDFARGSYEKEDIWPKGEMPDVQTNQCTPYIEWHLPKDLKTKAIQIIYSGGGYTGNDPNGFEVAPARRYLNEKGMTVVTMKYRTPRPAGLQKHVTAWADLQRAVRIVRSKAGPEPHRNHGLVRGRTPDAHGRDELAAQRRAWRLVDAVWPGRDPLQCAMGGRDLSRVCAHGW